MASRGLHLAIEDRHLEALRARPDPEALFDYVGELEEEFFESGFDAETDKAWGLIHQTLVREDPCADALSADGPAPLAYAVMGQEALCSSDWYLVTLTTASEVPRVNQALQAISQAEFEARLEALLEVHDCPNVTREDVTYASYWFENMKKAFAAGAEHKRHVIFTVDY
jgi:hypothetical protein